MSGRFSLLMGILLLSLGIGATASESSASALGEVVTCGWCWDFQTSEGWEHHFPSGGDECGWPSGEDCARCGGTSSCHTDFEGGRCHIACGPSGGLAAVNDEISRLLEAGDADGLASFLSRGNDHFYIAFIPQRSTIEIVPNCTPGKVESSHAVDRKLASQIEEAILLAD